VLVWCGGQSRGKVCEAEAAGGTRLADPVLHTHTPACPREFGPIFSWQLGNRRVVTLVDYDTVSSLLKLGDSKVSLLM
jgi:hypothetical protein